VVEILFQLAPVACLLCFGFLVKGNPPVSSMGHIFVVVEYGLPAYAHADLVALERFVDVDYRVDSRFGYPVSDIAA